MRVEYSHLCASGTLSGLGRDAVLLHQRGLVSIGKRVGFGVKTPEPLELWCRRREFQNRKGFHLDFPDISVDVHYLISKLVLQERRDGLFLYFFCTDFD